MSDFIRLSVPRQQDVQSNSIVVNAKKSINKYYLIKIK